MKTSVVLLILGLLISTGPAQASQEWVARYAGPTTWSDVPYAMTVDQGGHVYVTGTTATAGANDWTTIKYNASGAREWLRTLDGGGNDNAVAIATDAAGNVYVTGSSAGGLYYLTAKYNAAGAQQWLQTFADIGDGDAAVGIVVDPDGNAYVTGHSVTNGTGTDIVTIKYGPDGAELWVRRFDEANGEDVPAAIALDASGLYVTGTTGAGFTTIKYDFNGAQQWTRTYSGGFGNDSPAAMVADGAGHLYVTGQSAGSGTNADYVTIKYDAAGTELWVRRYDGPSTVIASDYDRAVAIALDANGNVFVTGNSSDDFATVKYDASGTEKWVRRYSGPAGGADWATAIAVDVSGNAYVSGSSYGGSGTQYDFATLSYDPAGAVRWTERYNGPGNSYDTPYSIGVSPTGDVYVSGSDGGSGTGLDYATIKYASVVTAVDSDPPSSAPRFALQVDPNPLTSGTKIRFTIPPGTDRDHVRLAVYDARGHEVALLVNEALAPGTYVRRLDRNMLASGIYWSRLQAGRFSEIRKLVRVK